MLKRYSLIAVLLLSSALYGQQSSPVPKYVPPDISASGEQAYYQDLAIIETSCTTWEDVRALWQEMTERGALIAVITSPQRWLGWVPAESRDHILGTSLPSARGSIGITSVSYSAAEFRKKQQGLRLSSIENEDAEEAIVEFLDFAKRAKTKEELERREDRGLELEYLQELVNQPECVKVKTVPDAGAVKGNQLQGIPEELQRRTRPIGLVVHTSFFPESQGGTGSWNWDATVYNRYRTFYVEAITYWTSLASKYGKTMTTIWLNYSPWSWVTQINGEPVNVGEHAFIPVMINRLRPPTVWDILFQRLPLSWIGNNGFEAGHAWGWYYNNKLRDVYNADQSIFGCIAWKGTPDEGIWPHAEVISWNNGDLEGVYFAMDVRYWQAGLDPFSASDRNVIAHEIGHVWGAPDEYRTDNCSWSYRGADNRNCQTERSATPYGRPGLKIHGFDAMMVGNYKLGTSSVTPVHVGLLGSGSITPLRCFSTQPANGNITIKTCDNTGYGKATRTFSKTMCIPMEWDFCHRTSVPLTRNISGTTWYFDYWEVKRENGATTNIDWYANEMPSYAFTSTQGNPVVDIKAVYTDSPPDIFTVNNTLTAWLAPANASSSPAPAIVLRWRNKYDMSQTQTKVEYERTPGNWVELTGANVTLGGPIQTGINQYTGVHIVSVPTGGGGNASIAANTQYRFRIVGYFNTIKGNPSASAMIRTRESAPPDSIFCYDTYEPNSSGSPRMLTSSGPGMTPYSFNAACPLTPYPAEFTWFVPKYDYYRITAINLTAAVFGEKLTLTLRVRDGSNFKPKFRAKRAGEATFINAISMGANTYRLNLTNDGEYVVSVEPEISTFISYRLVEPSTGHFGFGEYSIDVERAQNYPDIVAPCINCVKVVFMHPLNGLLLSKAPGDLFDKGMGKGASDSFFDVFFDITPGYQFDGWDLPRPGILEDPNKNPTRFRIGPNTPDGEYEIGSRLKPIDPAMAELVIIYPNGPDGPFQERTLHPIGTLVNIAATSTSTYQFVGWSHDSATTTNPLPVVMWRSKKFIAVWKEKPCEQEQMIKWLHRINFVNARQGTVTLEYGMDPTAGDGLEPGQVDLPPTPPPGTFDIRWINIPGSQGSTTDLRAIQQSFTYLGQVQTGTGTTPVNMSWALPPAPPNAIFMLFIQGEPAPLNMRIATSHQFTVEGRYSIRVEVRIPDCPPRTKLPEVVITPVRTDPKRFPCVEIGVQFRDRQTDMLYPLYNPYQFHVFERNSSGELLPAQINEILQLPTLTLYRLCTDEDDKKPDREIVIINDDPDDETKPDTIEVKIPIPIPTGQGNPVRFVQQHTGDWELISLPLSVKDPDANTIFPDPLARLYGFNTTTGVYDPVGMMDFGVGYWLKTNIPSTTYYGLEKLLFEWDALNGMGEPFGYGWNLIGALSKTIAVGSIQQEPAGGLRSIFGYDPVAGYVIPTNVETGRGYWVRVNPGTKLKMQSSGFTGGSTDATVYVKTARKLNLTGTLSFATDRGERQELFLTTSRLSASDVDDLLLPFVPPGNSLDVRTEAGTRYVPMGLIGLDVRASGNVRITFNPDISTASRYQLLDVRGNILADLAGDEATEVTVPMDGTTRLFFKAIVVASPSVFTLEPNYPNPFVPDRGVSTTLALSITVPSTVRLVIYDLMGREVTTLLDQDLPAGQKHVRWDGRDAFGRLVPAGTYFLRLEAVEGVRVQRITVSRYH